ncbi:hypothetical protein MAJ_00650, partial [Metarhizium majus ARSEF 297]
MCEYSQEGSQCTICGIWVISETPMKICGRMPEDEKFQTRLKKLKEKNTETEKLNAALQGMLLEKYEHAVKLKLAGYKTHTCVPNCDPQRLRDLASGKIQKRMYAEDLEKFHSQRENWLCRLAGTY